MPRGRKNHGVRQARYLKMQKRRVKRGRKWLHSRAKTWKLAHSHLRFAYVRPPPVYLPNVLMMPLHYYLVKPKKLPRHSDGPPGVGSYFAGGGRTNPHTKIIWPPGYHHHWPPDYITWFVRRVALRYPKRVHRQKKADVILACASRWYWRSNELHRLGPTSYNIGWPHWDPKGRLPKQIVPGING